MNKLTQIRQKRYSKMLGVEKPQPGNLMEAAQKKMSEQQKNKIKKIALFGG